SMKGGLTNSVNTISAEIMMDMGPGTAVKYARKFGFTSDLPQEPSLVLGTADLTLKEMAGAYSAFANEGMRVAPISITRIEDATGETLVSFPQEAERSRAMTPEVASMMQIMLQSVVDSGTARRLRFKYQVPGQIGGKTGTTQNQSDGWFMGVTPQLVMGVWVGGETRKVRFRTLSLGQGAATALPIAGLFLQDLYKHPSYRKWKYDQFPTPGLSIAQSLDCPMYSWDGRNPKDKKGLRDFLDQLRNKQKERKSERQKKRDERRKRNRDAWEDLFKKKKSKRF
ncbi:MAG: penicillin-binding transpeptidase domain-containing protein, partial [Bacteroidota bacterium]